jgi:hypothetical protein
MAEILQDKSKTRFSRLFQGFSFWTKRLCNECKQVKTWDADANDVPICEECSNKMDLREAKNKHPDSLSCPKCNTPMELGIITDAKNTVFHKCTKEDCHTMVIDQRKLKGITILKMDFYPVHLSPPDEEEKHVAKKSVEFSTN